MSNYWIADTPISMPSPPTAQRPVVYEFPNSGFGLTTYGIAVSLSEADREEMLSGFFGPPDGMGLPTAPIHADKPPAPPAGPTVVQQVQTPSTIPPPAPGTKPTVGASLYGEGVYGAGPYGGGGEE